MNLDPRKYTDAKVWNDIVYKPPGSPPCSRVQLSAFLPGGLADAQLIANVADETCKELGLERVSSFYWHGEREPEELIVNGAPNDRATALLRKKLYAAHRQQERDWRRESERMGS